MHLEASLDQVISFEIVSDLAHCQTFKHSIVSHVVDGLEQPVLSVDSFRVSFDVLCEQVKRSLRIAMEDKKVLV